ncbi:MULTISPECIES: four helix bundle protein [unclassified Francisella]|uniref:four helix bundle protein n=1 Tax=unclassified Francisella TaxID=2610885 RepID=UPI002E36073B|nr:MULTISPECIES: four helix bundle protein [unclassified Francisella]MED7818618.1 four helix bundle protein [Francisella sp. 19S2-4]MED7829454.1 four helix bundle protein [Francisella sp. 19S2-10]
MASSYRDLVVWQKAMELTKQVYALTNNFPKEEVYGLTSQIKRSSISIPSNIAEGKGRNTDREFVRFLQISLGSLYELQTQLELAKSFNYINDIENILKLSIEIEKMLNKLITVKGGRNV